MKSIARSVNKQITSKQLVNQDCPNNWGHRWFNLLIAYQHPSNFVLNGDDADSRYRCESRVADGWQPAAPWSNDQQQYPDEEDYKSKSVAEIRQQFNAPPAHSRKHGGTIIILFTRPPDVCQRH